MLRDLKSVRLLVVAVSMAAWFAASNHCVLTARPAATNVSGCPMHAQEQHAPKPEKGNGCGDLTCCKILRATTTAAAKLIAKPVWLGALQPFFPQVIGIVEIQPRKVSPLLDTGPPGENNFTQSVLQRSILAHAPPFFA